MPVDPEKKHRYEKLRATAIAAGLKAIITVREAADFARCHHRTIRRWIAVRRLPADKSDPAQRGTVLIQRDDLIKMIVYGSA